MARKRSTKTATFSSNEFGLSEAEAEELGKCFASPQYFIHNYCYIYDSVDQGWIKFDLWPSQVAALNIIHNNQLSVILKARQIGLTWLSLAYGLWDMIFRPIASVSIFSKRDVDAIYLLSEDRLRGMFDRLPDWMKEGHTVETDNAHEWSMENGSTARSFPTSAGDSYTSTLAIVDEADLSADLNSLLRAVKPTIDNGGKMVLLSRADKDKPISDFKRIYLEAKKQSNGWANIFLPWFAHPGRTQAWYDLQVKDIQSRTGSLDDLYEQYPATDSEALQPRSTDKRIPFTWLEKIFKEDEGDTNLGLTGLTVFKKPEPRRVYAIGADPAEGNPNSDDSAITVCDLLTGEEMAVLAAPLQPTTFADSIMKLSRFYNDAPALVERNNHGHAVILQLQNDGFENLLNGHDGRPGWLNSMKGKALMYTTCTNVVQNEEAIIHGFYTYQQLASIVGSTLKAPEHQHDDIATSFSLCQCARQILSGGQVGMATASVEGREVTSSSGVVRRNKIARKREQSPQRSRTRVIRTSSRIRNVQSATL